MSQRFTIGDAIILISFDGDAYHGEVIARGDAGENVHWEFDGLYPPEWAIEKADPEDPEMLAEMAQAAIIYGSQEEPAIEEATIEALLPDGTYVVDESEIAYLTNPEGVRVRRVLDQEALEDWRESGIIETWIPIFNRKLPDLPRRGRKVFLADLAQALGYNTRSRYERFVHTVLVPLVHLRAITLARHDYRGGMPAAEIDRIESHGVHIGNSDFHAIAVDPNTGRING